MLPRELIGRDCLAAARWTVFTTPQEIVLKVMTSLSAFCSLLGTLWIILGYLFTPELRKAPFYKLVVCLSVADFFVSATYLVDASLPLPHERRCPDALCYVLASSTQFFSLSSIIWTAIICHAVYSILSRAAFHGVIENVSKRGFCLYHLIAWSVPAVTVVMLVLLRAVGGAPLQCWISDESQWARFLLYYGPLLACEVYNISIYRIVSRAVSQTLRRDSVFGRIRRYLLVSLVCKGISLTNRTYHLLSPSKRPVFALFLLSSIGTPLQGLGNALVFGDQRRLRAMCKRWRRARPGQHHQLPDEEEEEEGGGLSPTRSSVELRGRGAARPPVVGMQDDEDDDEEEATMI